MSPHQTQQPSRPGRYVPHRIPSPRREAKIRLPAKMRRFLFPQAGKHEAHHAHHPWYQVLWLTGVDYFSTLGYQPGIALAAAGALSPFATIILVLVTLFGAIPTYRQVARRSFTGQGSIAMLENLLHGWVGKLLILVLLGFASTDFIITITLSAADAAAHIVENPTFSHFLGHSQLGITLFFLLLLACVFLMGFTEAISMATLVAVPYIVLNAIVIVKCLAMIAHTPELIHHWVHAPVFYKASGAFDWTGILITSAIIFPKLALGLSGFETGVSVMPLVEDKGPARKKGSAPLARIAGTQKLLVTAGVMMSLMLLASSFMTTTLLERRMVEKGGEAYGRAISHVAHIYMGNTFGTIYDISTVLILWFAGASALAGLLNIIPRYLPRLGMAPRWVEQRRPLVLVLLLISILVTLVFHADVERQAGAYATGVLVLILSAAVAVALSLWRDHKNQKKRSLAWGSVYFWGVAGVFLFTLVDNVIERPDGLIISTIFILTTLVLSGISRYLRAFEIRVESHTFTDAESERVWNSIRGKKVNLVPLSTPDTYWQEHREAMIRNYYQVNGPLAFLTIKMRDDRSEFAAPLKISARKNAQGNYLIDATGAVALPNTIAYISEEIDPIALYLGLARKNAMAQAFSYLLFGEGEIGIITYKVLVQYWESTEEDDVRPVIFLMSE